VNAESSLWTSGNVADRRRFRNRLCRRILN